MVTFPEFSAVEVELLWAYVEDLTAEQLRGFVAQCGGKTSGTKAELIERIKALVEEGTIALSDVVVVLDDVEPWRRQHVYLFEGPETDLIQWKSAAAFKDILKKHHVGKFLNTHVPMILPAKLSLSAIEHTDGRIRITAVERRDAWERDEALDKEGPTVGGADVQLRAYVHRV